MSYLVCDKCKRYYELQPGELPADFDDSCECGGNLKFNMELEGLKKDTSVQNKDMNVETDEDKQFMKERSKSLRKDQPVRSMSNTRKFANTWKIVRSHKREDFIKKVREWEEMGYKLHPESFALGVAGTGVSKYHALMSSNIEDNRVRASISKNNLFPCPDCGNNISKKAKACPKCGRELDDITTD